MQASKIHNILTEASNIITVNVDCTTIGHWVKCICSQFCVYPYLWTNEIQYKRSSSHITYDSVHILRVMNWKFPFHTMSKHFFSVKKNDCWHFKYRWKNASPIVFTLDGIEFIYGENMCFCYVICDSVATVSWCYSQWTIPSCRHDEVTRHCIRFVPMNMVNAENVIDLIGQI